MKLAESGIPGCYELTPTVFRDERGLFVKIFHEGVFAAHGLETRFAEEFYSVSRRGVMRGLHFQLPPVAVTKLVYCVAGSVFDAVVDLRAGSPTYGKFATFALSAERASMLYVPTGLAHGFYVTSESAIMVYKVSAVHSPPHDSGILWNSAGVPWPDDTPIISVRDAAFPGLQEFASPFRFCEVE